LPFSSGLVFAPLTGVILGQVAEVPGSRQQLYATIGCAFLIAGAQAWAMLVGSGGRFCVASLTYSHVRCWSEREQHIRMAYCSALIYSISARMLCAMQPRCSPSCSIQVHEQLGCSSCMDQLSVGYLRPPPPPWGSVSITPTGHTRRLFRCGVSEPGKAKADSPTSFLGGVRQVLTIAPTTSLRR
jgi:hypothetical protein